MAGYGLLLGGGFLLGAMAAAPAASAQSSATDALIKASEGEITVTARPDPAPQVGKARAQARTITDASNIFTEPLPLFQTKVCPGVSGLPLDLAEYVVARIRYNAQGAGLRLGKAGKCEPNLIVAFVLDGKKVLEKLAGKGNTILANIPAFERKQLLNDSGPVHAFVIAEDRTRDGMRAKWDPSSRYKILETQGANSLFLLKTRSDIQKSVVLIDIPAIDGLSAKQIADYATMRGLAKTRPVAGDATYGTILNLFAPDAGHPAGLTTFDIAYLKTLYSNAPNIVAAAKLGGLKYQMRKQLAATDADQAGDNN